MLNTMLSLKRVSPTNSLRIYSGDDRVIGFTRESGPSPSPHYWHVANTNGFGFQLKVASESGHLVGGSVVPAGPTPLSDDPLIPRPRHIQPGVPIVELAEFATREFVNIVSSVSVVIEGSTVVFQFTPVVGISTADSFAVQDGCVSFLVTNNRITGIMFAKVDQSLLETIR